MLVFYPQDKEEEKQKDVAPPSVKMGGYQQLVRGNPLRGKFRNSFEKPEPFVPGKVEPLSYQLGDARSRSKAGAFSARCSAAASTWRSTTAS